MWGLLLVGILALALFLVVIYYTRHSRRRPIPIQETAPAEPAYELPTGYGENGITTLVKDPHWIYAYWEITPTAVRQFESLYGPGSWELSQPLLHVYDLTELGHAATAEQPFLEIPLTGHATNWYIRVGRPRHTFKLKLGRRLPNNVFVPLVTSNIVTTPGDSISDVIDPLWPPLEAVWETYAKYGLFKGIPTPVSSPIFIGRRR